MPPHFQSHSSQCHKVDLDSNGLYYKFAYSHQSIHEDVVICWQEFLNEKHEF